VTEHQRERHSRCKLPFLRHRVGTLLCVVLVVVEELGGQACGHLFAPGGGQRWEGMAILR
jgi:hypothetical protein